MLFSKRSVSELAASVAGGSAKSADLVAESFAGIDERDEEVGAFISLCRDKALSRAAEIDALPPSDKAAMPLAGIPIAIKDNICTKGHATTCASHILENFVPPYSADVVERLEAAGAVIVGKVNLDEFAMGSSCENSALKCTRNPHDLTKIPGGSSGGSAAAVAAGFVPLALGSDTGGSIRLPASFCGVVGLKPTYGRVSRYGLVAFASSLDQIGPMSNSVRDAGTLLSVIAGDDRRDATCAGRPFENSPDLYSGSLEGMRVGIPAEYFGDGLDPQVRARVEESIDSLRAAGALTLAVNLPMVKHSIGAYYVVCTAEASSNLARFDGVRYGHRSASAKNLAEMYSRSRSEGFGAEVKRRIMLGTYVLSSGYYDAYYLKAAKVRTLISKDFDSAFERCDAIVSPVAPAAAFGIGEKSDDPIKMYLTDIYTVSANLAGIPGISVPSGTVAGLPVGVQFMAPKWRENTLIRLGHTVEQARIS